MLLELAWGRADARLLLLLLAQLDRLAIGPELVWVLQVNSVLLELHLSLLLLLLLLVGLMWLVVVAELMVMMMTVVVVMLSLVQKVLVSR